MGCCASTFLTGILCHVPSFEPSPFCLEKMLLGEGKLGKVGKGFHTKANVWVGCISRPLNGSLDDPGRIIWSPQKGHIGVNMFKLSVRHGQNHLFAIGSLDIQYVLSVYSSGILQNDLVFNGILSSTVWTKSQTKIWNPSAEGWKMNFISQLYLFVFLSRRRNPFSKQVGKSWKHLWQLPCSCSRVLKHHVIAAPFFATEVGPWWVDCWLRRTQQNSWRRQAAQNTQVIVAIAVLLD